MCENVTCIQPATERVVVHTTGHRSEIDDTLNLCTKHADIVSAQQKFGPGIRQWAERTPIIFGYEAPDACL